MGKQGAEDTPEIETSNEEFLLNVRQAHVPLNQASGIGTDSNIIAQVARVDGCTHGKDVGFTGQLEVSI